MSNFHTDDDKIIDLPDPRIRERILRQLSAPAPDADNDLQQAQELIEDDLFERNPDRSQR